MYRSRQKTLPGIAGVKAPAFIERVNTTCAAGLVLSWIAGVKAPAFIERT